MTTYYVSNDGNDNNDGITEQTPWQTLDKVNSIVFLPGDFVLFRAEDKFRGILENTSTGTEDNEIKYGYYGNIKSIKTTYEITDFIEYTYDTKRYDISSNKNEVDYHAHNIRFILTDHTASLTNTSVKLIFESLKYPLEIRDLMISEQASGEEYFLEEETLESFYFADTNYNLWSHEVHDRGNDDSTGHLIDIKFDDVSGNKVDSISELSSDGDWYVHYETHQILGNIVTIFSSVPPSGSSIDFYYDNAETTSASNWRRFLNETIDLEEVKETLELEYPIDLTKNYVISFTIGDLFSHGAPVWYNYGRSYFSNSPNSSVLPSPSGFYEWDWMTVGIKGIVITGNFINIWRTWLDGPPVSVTFDDVEIEESWFDYLNEDISPCWCYNDNWLYVWSNGSPPSNWTIKADDVELAAWDEYTGTYSHYVHYLTDGIIEGGKSDYLYRVIIPKEIFNLTGDKIRFNVDSTFYFPGTSIYGAAFGEAKDEGSYDIKTVHNLTFNTVQGIDINYYNNAWTDWVDFFYNNKKEIILSLSIGDNDYVKSFNNSIGWKTGYKSNSKEDYDLDVVTEMLSELNTCKLLKSFEIQINLSNVYKIERVNRKPYQVLFNDINGSEVSSVHYIRRNGEWFWSEDGELFIYSVGNPNSFYDSVKMVDMVTNRPIITGLEIFSGDNDIGDSWTTYSETVTAEYYNDITTANDGWPESINWAIRQTSINWEESRGNTFWIIDADEVSIGFKASPYGSLPISGCYIGKQAPTPNLYSMLEDTITQLLFDGNENTLASPDEIKWTDWENFVIDKTQHYVISFVFGDKAYVGFDDQYSGFYLENDAANIATPVVENYTGSWNFIYGVKLRKSTNNIWKKENVTYEPTYIEFDGIKGSKKFNIFDLKEQYNWIWLENVLYVYSENDPNTDFNNPGIEAVQHPEAVRCLKAGIYDATPVPAGASENPEWLIYDNLHILGGRFTAAAWHGVNHLLIENCEFEKGRINVYVSYGNDIVIRRCKSHDSYDQHGLYIAMDCSNVLVELSEFYNNNWCGIQFNLNFGLPATNCIVRYNKIYNNKRYGLLDLGSESNKYYYNLIYDNTYGGVYIDNNPGYYPEGTYAVKNAEIYNNFIAAIDVSCFHGLWVGNYCVNNKIKNNIIYWKRGLVEILRFTDTVENIQTNDISNNCFYAPNFTKMYVLQNYDLFLDSLSELNSNLLSLGASADFSDNIEDNPLVKGFYLKSNSPCRNTGADVNLDRDFDGNDVPVYITDIGAMESRNRIIPGMIEMLTSKQKKKEPIIK